MIINAICTHLIVLMVCLMQHLLMIIDKLSGAREKVNNIDSDVSFPFESQLTPVIINARLPDMSFPLLIRA